MSVIPQDAPYQMNADRQALHYVKREQIVRRGDVIKLRMVRNGGYAARLVAQ